MNIGALFFAIVVAGLLSILFVWLHIKVKDYLEDQREYKAKINKTIREKVIMDAAMLAARSAMISKTMEGLQGYDFDDHK